MIRTRLFGAASLVACLAGMACGQDSEAAKREYVRSGDRYVAEKKYPEAVIEYRNAVQQDPKFGEARFKLAEAYAKLGDPKNAYGEYIRAADLMPNDVKAQVEAARILLLARQFEDAQARADKALAIDPKNISAQIAKGNALAGLENLDGAIGQIEAAIKLDPARGSTYANLGALESARGNQQEAEAAFKKAVDADPKSTLARLALANFYWSTKRPEDAERTLQEALSIDPKDAAINRAMAVYLMATKQVAKAEPYLKTLAEVSKESSDTFALADYYVANRRSSDARTVLEALTKNEGESFAGAKIRLAAMALQEGDRKSAAAFVEEVLTKQPDHVDGLAIKATLLLEDKKYDEALPLARQAVARNASSEAAQYALGRVHMARQDVREATAAFGEVLKLNPRNNRARVDLARLALADRRPEDAIQFAQEALTEQPGHAEATLVLARARLMKGDTAGAESQTRALALEFPKSASVQVQLGQLSARKGDTDGARRAFEQALAVEPGHLEALMGLTSLDLRAKNPTRARSRVEARLTADPQNPRLQVLAARVYMAVGDTAAAERTLRKAIEINPGQMEGYALLGQLYAGQKRLDEARAEFDRLAEIRPSAAVGAYTFAGVLLQLQNKPAEAQARFEKAIALDPNAAVAANNLAWLYAERGGNLDVALQLAQTARSHLSDRHEVSDTLGWVLYKKGLASLAVPPFRESVEKDPKNPVYHYHLGLAYAKSGNKAEAIKALQEALRLNPKFDGAADAQQMLAGL
ncbi:MAG TPA: tetratricopeptide repeat protein [Vicinamibacterales bacterium]|nr:tetratricopeptide repeat protein [Vicinamibacterales bacterium]